MFDGYKFYKINKELFNSEYFIDVKCELCKHTDMNIKFQFPYRMDDVCYVCKKCNSRMYYNVTDVLYYYSIYSVLVRLVGNTLKPGEVKDVSKIYENNILNDYNKIIKRNRYILASIFFTFFIVGYILWNFFS